MDIAALAQSLAKAAFEADRTTLVMRKQRDVEVDQAQALIALVKQSVPEGTGRLIDVRV